MSTPLRPQNTTLTGSLPRDRPYDQRPHRLYVATSTHCNRACPWCSTYSSPRGQTWLSLSDYLASFPAAGDFEVQLEGGEPTIHPDFWEQVRLARQHPRCQRLIVVTNGVVLPRRRLRLRNWLQPLGDRHTLKLSINHYLLEHDEGLLRLARLLHQEIPRCGADCQLVVNVRIRKGVDDDDRWVVRAVEEAGLMGVSNVFYLQRYGLASDRTDWEEPFLVGANFSMVVPDGRVFGPDLIARSEAMGRMG